MCIRDRPNVELASVCPYAIDVAVGAVVIVGVALPTVTFTFSDTVLYLVASVGVKVTPCAAVPAWGCVAGVVNANVPGTLAAPPPNVELASVCPYAIDVAVGAVVIVGVALATVTFTFNDTVLYRVVSVGVKLTPCSAVPTFGWVVGVVKAKVPATLATPPPSVELASVCPNVIDVAVGAVVIVGVALPTVTFTFSDTVL